MYRVVSPVFFSCIVGVVVARIKSSGCRRIAASWPCLATRFWVCFACHQQYKFYCNTSVSVGCPPAQQRLCFHPFRVRAWVQVLRGCVFLASGDGRRELKTNKVCLLDPTRTTVVERKTRSIKCAFWIMQYIPTTNTICKDERLLQIYRRCN
jgi:hypothetical protein